MQYKIDCKCGRVLEGVADHDNYGVRCRCGKMHVVTTYQSEPMALESDNPYESPASTPPHRHRKSHGRRDGFRESVGTAAIGLIVCSIIMLVYLVFSFSFSVFLLSTDTAERLPQPSTMNKRTQVQYRLAYSIILMICNGVVLTGAINLKNMDNYFLARASAILSVIPCCGPCYVLGIPFGIMALTALNRPEIRDTFRS